MLTRWWKSKKEELKEKKGPLQSIRLLPLEWGKASAFAESTWVLFAGMKSCPQGMDFRLMVQGFSLSPSFSTISTTTSLHVFQVGRQDSMNLMPLHCLRFGPRSNRCEHEFQRVRRLRPSENSLLEQRTKTSTILLAPKAAAFLGPRTTTEEHIYGCMSDDWVCIGKVIYLSMISRAPFEVLD